MFLENRSILFFSAQAFGYQNEIRAEMERMGARVDYFDERPANSFAVKAAIRINRNLLARYIDRYHARIIERTKNRKYDYVFFIKGESISVENLDKIKKLHPEAKLIIYHWDSIANNRNALRILPVFDRAFSFDKPDCEKLGIRFLPLFYLRDYEKIGRQELTTLRPAVRRYGSQRPIRAAASREQADRAGRRTLLRLHVFPEPDSVLENEAAEQEPARHLGPGFPLRPAAESRLARPLPQIAGSHRHSASPANGPHDAVHRNDGRQEKTHNYERTYRRIRLLRPEQHSDRRPAESVVPSGFTASPTGTYLPKHTTGIGSTAGSKRSSNRSTSDRNFDERRILHARAVCVCRQPSRLSDTIFHRANRAYDNPFRHIVTSWNTFPF
ncbi:MAG: hypothetical protein ACLR76_09765 [Alistipes sp.]